MENKLEKLLKHIAQNDKNNKLRPRDLSNILNMRMDSVYRRLRGEVEFNLSELELIARHYKVSLDAVLFDAEGAATFQFNQLFSGNGNIFPYIRRINELMQRTSRNNGQVTYINTDLPLHLSFGNSLIRRFKGYYWQKVLFNSNELKQTKFSEEFRLDPRLETEMDLLSNTYQHMKRTEIWADTSLSNSIRQVKYCKNIGLFESESIQDRLKMELENILTAVEEDLTEAAYTPEANHTQLYLSSIELGNNCVQFEFNNEIYTFLGFANFNSITSTSHPFGEENRLWIQAVKAKSVLLTGQSEVIRHQFFEDLKQQIQNI